MSKSTRYANILKKCLEKLGLKVGQEVWDGHKHIDLSIDSAKLDIEVDGMQHLTNAHQITADLERARYSREDGYETIHIHNIDINYNAKSAEEIAKAVAKVAEKREEDFITMAGTK